MAPPHSAAAKYNAALPEIRRAVRNLDGHLARRALAQVLAELIVDGTSAEAPQCVEHRLHFSEAHLQETIEELCRVAEGAGS